MNNRAATRNYKSRLVRQVTAQGYRVSLLSWICIYFFLKTGYKILQVTVYFLAWFGVIQFKYIYSVEGERETRSLQ